ncbi:MAG: hypothetical protein JWM34_4905 [Ilumatobacteraceae bacterium]|nr:hypothetical protein [Ilumatobacteraceae bacterium]
MMVVQATRPTFGVLIRRALLLQCAWCGSRPGFRRGWFHRHDACQHCGMSVQRGQDGFELGAASINAMLSLGLLIVAGAISIIDTYPDVAIKPLMIVLGIAAVVLPVLLYPFTYTLWFAVELMMEPPSPTDVAAAAARTRAAGAPLAS